jgi:hypothetical protein
MSRLNLILLPSMLALALPAWAASGGKPQHARPLNLSVPRDVIEAPGDRQIDKTVERNLRAPATPRGAHSPSHPAALPYGAGYEHRHPDTGGQEAWTGTGAGPGSNGAGAGAGRRGR